MIVGYKVTIIIGMTQSLFQIYRKCEVTKERIKKKMVFALSGFADETKPHNSPL